MNHAISIVSNLNSFRVMFFPKTLLLLAPAQILQKHGFYCTLYAMYKVLHGIVVGNVQPPSILLPRIACVACDARKFISWYRSIIKQDVQKGAHKNTAKYLATTFYEKTLPGNS